MKRAWRARFGRPQQTPPAPVPMAAPAADDAASRHYRRGLELRSAGQHREALAAFQLAIDARHDFAEAHLHAARTHRDLGEAEDASDRYLLALAFDPGCTGARLDLATLHTEAGDLHAAIALLEEAVKADLAELAIFSRLAKLHKHCGNPQAARAVFERALEKLPDEPVLHVNFGMLWLGHLGDPVRAEAHFMRALFLRPGFDIAQSNLGIALQDQGRHEEAIALYERSIAARPEPEEYRWNRAIALLALGRFDEGWPDYELRKYRPDARRLHKAFKLPDWGGGPLAGRSILVYAEQGVGDEIMFASCLPEVVAQTGACVIECDARLAPLFERSFPQARIAHRADAKRKWRELYPGLELQSACGSLPRYLRRRIEDFPAHAGYLRADPAAVEAWRARLPQAGRGRHIGLSWRAGTLSTRGPLRSMALETLAPLFALSDTTFVILQRDLSEAERAALTGRDNVLLPDLPQDLDALAALVCALDLLVAVPSTLVHLAGALGRPAWGLLARTPEWRYGVTGERMPWYPSLRLFRQGADGWGAVVDQVRADLANVDRSGGVPVR
ncbi:MAG TPA: tetratricopeptide repeat-containing glycosyltransferase family protein [Burkholderiales bacterium]